MFLTVTDVLAILTLSISSPVGNCQLGVPGHGGKFAHCFLSAHKNNNNNNNNTSLPKSYFI